MDAASGLVLIWRVKFPGKLKFLLRVPPVTRPRIFAAFAVALAADGGQLLLGPLGWVFLDQAIDCMTMIVLSRLLGFHVLFLPTFVVELVPLLEDLPTWTACTAAVIVLRQRGQKPPPPDRSAIEI